MGVVLTDGSGSAAVGVSQNQFYDGSSLGLHTHINTATSDE